MAQVCVGEMVLTLKRKVEYIVIQVLAECGCCYSSFAPQAWQPTAELQADALLDWLRPTCGAAVTQRLDQLDAQMGTLETLLHLLVPNSVGKEKPTPAQPGNPPSETQQAKDAPVADAVLRGVVPDLADSRDTGYLQIEEEVGSPSMAPVGLDTPAATSQLEVVVVGESIAAEPKETDCEKPAVAIDRAPSAVDTMLGGAFLRGGITKADDDATAVLKRNGKETEAMLPWTHVRAFVIPAEAFTKELSMGIAASPMFLKGFRTIGAAVSALNAGQCSEMIVTQLHFCIIRESSSKKLVIL